MRARHQLVLGVSASAGSMAASLLVVPLYVRILGMEAYGLVGFLALMQGLMQVLDLGFAPTISRQVARDLVAGSFKDARALLASLASLYAVTGIAIMIIVALTSSLIATHWLQPRALSPGTVTTAVVLIGVVLAVRWPVGIYSGTLIGAHRLPVVSLVTLLYALSANLGGIALILIVPRVEALFAWQALAGFGQLLALRQLAWHAVGAGQRPRPSLAPLLTVWRFSAGMALVTLAAVSLQQLDKLLVSRLVSLEAFGTFALASLLGRALYGFINPLYNLIQPRFTAMLASPHQATLCRVYRYWTTLFCCLFFPASAGLALAATPLLMIWTGDAQVATKVAPLVALIAVGAALHGVMYFPFALQVAAGDARTPLLINVSLIVFYVPILAMLLSAHGLLGAAQASVLLFAFYVLIGTVATHRRWLKGLASSWLVMDVGLPALLCLTVGGLAMELSPTHATPAVQLAIAIMVACVSGLCCLMVAAARYSEFRAEWRLLASQFIRTA